MKELVLHMAERFLSKRNLINYICSFGIIGLLLLIGCQKKISEIVKLISYYDEDQTQVHFEGYIKDSLETGEWKYFNKNGNILKAGSFIDGLKTGDWIYEDPNEIDTTIVWLPRKKEHISLSIPEGWNIIGNNDIALCAIADDDSLNYIAILELSDSTDIETHFRMMFNDFKKDPNESLVNNSGRAITFTGGKILAITYDFDVKNGNEIWKCFGSIVKKDDLLLEVVLRHVKNESNSDAYLWKVFSELLETVEIEGDKLISQFELIDTVRDIDLQ